MPAETIHIGIPIFPAVTQLDFTGPWEVLTRIPGAKCHLLAHEVSPVTSANGMTILPTLAYENCPPLDMVCVPGGPGHLNAMQDAALLAFLQRTAESGRYVTAVCTGTMVLAAAGLLRGYRATTHWMSLDRLAAFGATPVNERVVIDRNRVTGGGVTAGIDFALTIAGEIAGADAARKIQLQVEYDPAPPFAGGSLRTADAALVAAVRNDGAPYVARMAKVDAEAAARLGA
jgi:cyclohexyl-isocyanide hydratase